MCLILAAWQVDPAFPLVIAANRDEYFARPTRSATFWPESPDLLAGRDLSAGGTWLGITRGGRFAALTNFRDPARERGVTTSRGALVRDFLQSNASVQDYLAAVQADGDRYNGFNLLVGDGTALACYNNIEHRIEPLAPGIHGLSNHVLNTPWPKITLAGTALKASLRGLPDTESLFGFLRDDTVAEDEALPHTGVSLEWERRLSSIFVRSPAELGYGTRSSTVLMVGSDGLVIFDEKEWNADGGSSHRQRVRFALDKSDHGRPAH